MLNNIKRTTITLHVYMIILLLLTLIFSRYSLVTIALKPIDTYYLTNLALSLPLIESQFFLNSLHNVSNSTLGFSLISNLIDTKIFTLSNKHYLTKQEYLINSEDLAILSNVNDYFNVLPLGIMIIFYKISSYFYKLSNIIRF